MAYEIFIEKKAEKDLRKLPKNYQSKIIQKILSLKKMILGLQIQEK
jgi:mRNA-degrading endonuclease RelE of RelBE toxin-antitoxin system